jgi:hypothetical protein
MRIKSPYIVRKDGSIYFVFSVRRLLQYYQLPDKTFHDISRDIWKCLRYLKIFIYSMICRGSRNGVLRTLDREPCSEVM